MTARLTVIVGRPGSGKTRLAQESARRARGQGLAVLVSDPFRDPRWETEYLWSSPGELLRVALAVDSEGRPLTTSCLVVVDEAGVGGHEWREATGRLARAHRHHGHAVILLAHRWTDVPPVARSSAQRVVALPQGARSASEMAAEYGLPDLEASATLPVGEALVAELWGAASVRRVRLW